MEKFTIPQRKAYVAMLERYQSKVYNRNRWNNPARRSSEDEVKKRLKLDEVRKKVEDTEKQIESEMSKLDQLYDDANRKELKSLALSISELWGCESAEQAKKIVEKFVSVEFPDGE